VAGVLSGMFGDGSRAEALELARDAWRRALASVARTPGLLLLSVLLGVSLWVFVTDTENPTIVERFPQPLVVVAVNVDESLAVANQLPTITVRVSAPSDRWEQLTVANFRAVVDLANFDARSQEVPVEVEIEGVNGVRVVDTEPSTITVNLEDLVTKQVPVDTRIIGTLPIGYELGEMTPDQSEVTVSGPDSLVQLVSTAAADVNVTGLTVGVEQTVELKPLGAGGSEIRGVRIEPVSLRVGLEVTQSTIVRTVPLSVEVIGSPAPGFRVSGVDSSPPAVRVQGPIEALQALDTIDLPAVNVNGARTDIVRSMAIPLPPGLSFVDTERATVTVTVTAIPSTLETTVAVVAGGLGTALDASFDVPNISLVLEGPLPVLNTLTGADLGVVVDVSGRPPGVYTLPVEVSPPDGVEVLSVQPGNVTVTITAR